jgi:hypothetical protein
MVERESSIEGSHVTSATIPSVTRASRWRLAARIALAGPIALLLSAMILAGMPLWLPRGVAGVDHIILPLILLPAVWAALFFYAVLDRSLVRVAFVALVIGAAHGVMLVSHFATPLIASTSHTSQDTKR